ncbi:thioredoxin family protein [Stratiformator vulcanicus]|uniref:Peroxiredoxin n=1 Tax=Stratiformator vulcanicus TaxID=2527980 RepID=A0A517R348_9PLAN|nr:thioredoxin family protein [Stratiformator vulcanicus]QDT38267.1 Putative peroxiredoxin [Stratiformator vulcanicus]
MVKTASTMLPLGTEAPDFSLPDPTGQVTSRADLSGNPLLVMFICNHCPFVKHLNTDLAKFADEYRMKGINVVGISSNDVENYPADSPEKMAEEILAVGYSFPYLYDETQEVAKAYTAACTPDFFLFDAEHKLVYRGQFDDSRPGNDKPITGKDLRAACDQVLAGESVPEDQSPSIGCNIKWKQGNEPKYFTGVSVE